MKNITHNIHGDEIYMVIEPDIEENGDVYVNDICDVYTNWDRAVEHAKGFCNELGTEVYLCRVTLTPVMSFEGVITSRPLTKGNK